MKRFLLIVFSLICIAAGIYLLFLLFKIRTSDFGALRIATNIEAEVYLNGKLIGNTPLCKCEGNDKLAEGEYTMKLVPADSSMSPFETKVYIGKNVLTAVERMFLPNNLSSAYILHLEKINAPHAELLVKTVPENAIVTLDQKTEGISPFTYQKLADGDHEIEVQKQGYNKKTIRAKAVPSYRLVASIFLGLPIKNIPTATTTATLSPTTSPTPSTASTSAIVRILDTPTGFLRVRETPSLSGNEVGRVSPGDELLFLDEQNGWYKIQLDTKKEGWVSSTFAEKIMRDN